MHHRAERAHAAIGFVRSTLEQHALARAFVEPREQAADHHGVGPGRERFGDVSRVANASVGDERCLGSLDRLRRFVNRGDLRHTDAGDDPRRADRSRPDAHFHRVGPGFDEVARSVARGHVAGHDVDVPPPLHLADRFDHVGRVAVGAIDDEEIDVLADQAAGPLEIKHSDGRSDPQPTLAVFGCLREAAHHVDVFDRNQSGQSVIFVNQQKLLDLFCHQNLLSLLKRYGPACCHERAPWSSLR